MMIVVIADDDADAVLKSLLEAEYRVTRLASTGGFFRRGNTTLMIGTEDERVDRALEVIRQTTQTLGAETGRRATVFVLKLADFQQV
jgi:uncharacterized protein YaaQ